MTTPKRIDRDKRFIFGFFLVFAGIGIGAWVGSIFVSQGFGLASCLPDYFITALISFTGLYFMDSGQEKINK
jgi:hypothetical protein